MINHFQRWYPPCFLMENIGLAPLVLQCSTMLSLESSCTWVVKNCIISSQKVLKKDCFVALVWYTWAWFLSVSHNNCHCLKPKLKKHYAFWYFFRDCWIEAIGPKLHNGVSFGSRLVWPKLENTGLTLLYLSYNAPQCKVQRHLEVIILMAGERPTAEQHIKNLRAPARSFHDI